MATFTLVKVELTNIRSFAEAVIEPAVDGVTALSGPNGAGKSTIVEAITWCLAGAVRPDVPVASMRRQNSDGPCQASVTIRHDSQDVTITRGLTGIRDTTVASVTIDGMRVATGARAVNDWVKARLDDLDPEGLLTAVIVRQKELDGLLTATPADRRRRIERLAGIEQMAAAVRSARDESRDHSKLLEARPDVSDDLAHCQDAHTAARHDVTTAEQAVTASSALEAAAREHADAATRTAADLDAAAAAARDAQHAAAEAAAARDTADATVTRLQTEISQVEPAARGGDPATVTAAEMDEAAAGQAIADHHARLARARDRAEACRANHRQAVETETEHSRRLSDAQSHLANLQARAEELAATLDGEPALDTLDATITDAARSLSEVTEKLGGLRSTTTRLHRILDAVNLAESEAHCPTCRQPVEDLTALHATIAAEATEASAAEQALCADQAALDSRLAEARAHRARLAALHAEHTSATQSLAKATEQVQALTSQVATLNEQAAAAAAAASAADSELAAASDETALLTLTANRDQARDRYRRATEAAAANRRLTQLTAELAAAQRAATEAAAAAHAATAQAASHQVDDQALSAARAAATEAAARLADARAALERSQGEHRLALAALEHHADTLRRLKEASARRADQMHLAETAAATAAALEAFRRDRVARLAPELAEAASGYLSVMSDGRYTHLELDGEFTPTVYETDGTPRSAAWLSGGEADIVAFALRVAIGDIVTGARAGGLLVLDEVLAAQDEPRRATMMNLIKDLPGRQVLSISHVADVTDVADKVITLHPEADGTVLVDHSIADLPLENLLAEV